MSWVRSQVKNFSSGRQKASRRKKLQVDRMSILVDRIEAMFAVVSGRLEVLTSAVPSTEESSMEKDQSTYNKSDIESS